MRLKAAVAAALIVILVVPLLAVGQISLRRGSRQDSLTAGYDSHFVFTRVRYGGAGGLARGFYSEADGWAHDYPTADRNLTAILDYITNMRVRIEASNILDLDDPRIFENPVLYMSEPGFWTTDKEEAKNLRAYLLKGGLLILDDFDGAADWENMVAQMKEALPDHYFVPLDVTHPVFQSFFGIKTLDVAHPIMASVAPEYLAIFENNDRSGRMLALANWNNDLGDYWEWSAEGLYGEEPTNDAYRLGVNYIVYAMTH
jgi:hypothetical protein